MRKKTITLILLFIFTTQISYFTFAAHLKLRQTHKFENNLSTTIHQSELLSSRLTKLDDKLNDILNAIKKAEKMSKDVSKLNKGLKVTLDVLTAMEVVPEVGSVAKEVKKVVSELQGDINTFDKKLKSFVKKLKKIKKVVQPTEKVTKKSIKALTTIKLISIKHYHQLSKISKCIYKQKKKHIQRKLGRALEKYSRIVSPIDQSLNSVLSRCNKTINQANRIVKEVAGYFHILDKVWPSFHKIFKVFNKMYKVLRKIKKVFNYKIKIPYSLKVKVKIKHWYKPWSWKWHVKTVKFRFTIHQILKGINTGMHWLNKKFLKYAMRPIKPLLRKLHIRFPKIKALSKFYSKLRRFEQRFTSIFRHLHLPKLHLRDIFPKFKSLHLKIKRFRIRCSSR